MKPKKKHSPKLTRKIKYSPKEEAIRDMYLVTSSLDMCLKELLKTESKSSISNLFERMEIEYGRLSHTLRELRNQYNR